MGSKLTGALGSRDQDKDVIMVYGRNQLVGLALLSLIVATVNSCGRFHTPDNPDPILSMSDSGWAQDQSDLEQDPSIEFGRLANGVRYILKQNRTPRDRVSMHLYVQSGSLLESEAEQGMAHFLEHMLFDGSTHFPPGEMVKYFQRIGMQFGPDANAHTGINQTVFDILLPRGDGESLSEGLVVLQDYAQGALLLPEEVEKEKKVVLAEKRSRDSAKYRSFQETFHFELDGTLPSRRLPIGKEETIKSFTPEKLRTFYETWYRPERMILVVVGDFEPKVAEGLIETQFGTLKPRAVPKQFPDLEPFSHFGDKAFYHFEKESGAASVSIEVVEHHRQPQDTVDDQFLTLLQWLADEIVQKRLDVIIQAPDSGLTSANISSGYYLQHIRYADISADCEPEKWKIALPTIEQTLRKALSFGFTISELDRAKNVFLADLKKDVNEENTRDSKDLARMIMQDLGQWRVTQSPSQRLALLSPMLEKITLDQVNKAFSDVWSANHRLIMLTGNAQLDNTDASAKEIIMAAYRDSQNISVKPPIDKATDRFPYLPVPTLSGKIVSQAYLSDLGIDQVEFANGLRLVLKQTDYKANEVLATLSFGFGKSSEPAGEPGLAELTESAANESGFGKMDKIALENALAGRLARISFDIREDQFVLAGQSSTSELELLFQLFQTGLMDPGYRTEALQVGLKLLEQKYRTFEHQVEGVMRIDGQKALAGGDSRFGFAEPEQMQKITIEKIKRWLAPQIAHAPIEIAIVGDFDPKKVIELAARYLATLPERSPTDAAPVRPAPEFAKGQMFRFPVRTNIEKSLVAVSYPTEDFWDIQRTRRLNVLAAIVSERLRIRVREKLGAAYSPYAYHRAFRAYTGFGYLQSIFLIEPAAVETIIAETKLIAEELSREGISTDELRRALDPTLTQIKDLRQSNVYWLNSVMVGSSRHPEQIDWARTIESDYAAITVEDINRLANRYLDNDKSSVIIVEPDL